MDNENRFSVLLLEKDVLEYNHFKAKYEEFDALSKTTIRGFFYKNYYKEQKILWYNKYIKKMSYLEKRYRKTNIYTKFHEQIETPVSGGLPPDSCTSPAFASESSFDCCPSRRETSRSRY